MYHYSLPTPEDMFAKSNDGTSSKQDLFDTYLQIKVDENCSKLLTVDMQRGQYKYNKLHFGLKVTFTIFRQDMDAMLVEGISCLV